MNKSFENKMSPALSMFNHIYKEFNEIYHEATLKMGLSDSAFDILYSIVDLVFEIAPLHNPANLEADC